MAVDSSRRFSTKALPPDQKHRAWLDLGTPAMGALFDARPTPGFEAYAERVEVGQVTLIFGWYGAQSIVRGDREMAQQPLDILCITIAGTMSFEGPLYRIPPGSVGIVDFTKPFSHHSTAGSLISVIVPCDYARSLGLAIETLHGMVVPAANAALLHQHVLALRPVAEDLTGDLADRAARTIVDLVAIAVGLPTLSVGTTKARLNEALKRRAEQIVTASVDPCDIDVDILCTMLGVSRSTLYQLYHDEGGVQHRIKRERLTRARGALLEPGARIGDVALRFGYADAAHFSRVFRSAFGTSPTGWRAAGRTADNAPLPTLTIQPGSV